MRKDKKVKLLVIQEQHFTRMPNGEVWVDEQSNSEFWERYLEVFEEIVVCARFIHSETYNTRGLMLSDHEYVSFVELPDFSGVAGLLKNIYLAVTVMRHAMQKCDRIIFRAPSPISMIAYPIARISGKPYAAEIMNNPYTHFSPAAMHHFYQRILRWLIVKQTQSLCKSANGISYVTEKILQESYPSKARMRGESKKYFEGSYSTIHMEASKYNFSKWVLEKPNEIILIHVGKMQDNRKGQDIFIQVIAKLKACGYSVRGILVGDGRLRQKFEDLAKSLNIYNYLRFTGWMAGFESVQQHLRQAHLAIFPSMGEGLPRAIIEAMSQGLLCLGSEVDGICELLDGECLVPNLTVDCFVEHIVFFLENWEMVEITRKKQYDVSLRYESGLLQKRRKEFYQKLYDVE